ncbi:MAG: SsrA-binding protein SmpB [Bacteroidota bacterium]|nr:SsrA-binding protein SmpB [Bacteroidota bacterium]
MSVTEEPTIRIIATNRRARHDYHILEIFEVGVVLQGTEVKSVRAGQVSFQDSYATVQGGELFLIHLHISPFEKGNVFNHDPVRTRKLLARKREIRKLSQYSLEKGLTLIPLQLYFKGPYLKIELGVCRGKKLYDKRQSVKEREIQRDIARNRLP